MNKTNPVIKVKGFATNQSVRLSEKTMAKTVQANNFLTDLADVFFFISRFLRETFSRNFEFKEFLRQCFQIGYKSLLKVKAFSSLAAVAEVGLVNCLESDKPENAKNG